MNNIVGTGMLISWVPQGSVLGPFFKMFVFVIGPNLAKKLNSVNFIENN